MKEVNLPGINAAQTLDIVRDLRTAGLVQGVDFNFSVFPPKWNTESPWEQLSEKSTTFIFYDDKRATMFILKYGGTKWQ